jgi:Ca-activated chloride channel homolog
VPQGTFRGTGRGEAVGPIIGRTIIGALVAVLVFSASLSAQRGTFRAGVELINVGVMVLDKRGNFVTDLKPENFEVYEEGQKQRVAFFSRGDATEEASNLHLGLLFDTSGSMTEDIQLSRTAAVKFLRGLNEAQDVTLVDFDTEVRVARYSQADFPRLIERIRQRKPDGLTALYDAVGIYLDGADELDGRKVLVLYTDGGDTRSAVRFSDVLEMLRACDVTLYVIGFLEHQSLSLRNEQKIQLQQLAETTGGQAFFPTSTRALDDLYAKVAAQIRAQYSLGFTSSNPRKDGAWRKLEVRLAGVGAPGVKVRSRRGYYAPLRDAVTATQPAHPQQ